MLKIAIDAMGGDFGCEPVIEGLKLALTQRSDFEAILVGDENVLNTHLSNSMLKRVSVVHANEVFEMQDNATNALKRKETSVYKAVELVKDNIANAVVSPGHSGAFMSLSTVKIGRLKGIIRPAIATLMPTTHDNKFTLVLDVGANTDCKSEHLVQFAIMGKHYAKDILSIKNPKIGLLSNGEEKSKGNEVTKAAFEVLSKFDDFIGNVEGNQIFDGSVDIIVCDGFIGNIALKTAEGVADSITKIIKKNIKSSPVAIAGAVLMNKVFKLLKKQVGYDEYGGAPLLGLNGCAIVSHGKSNANAIKNAIFQAIKFANSNVNFDILNDLENQNKPKDEL